MQRTDAISPLATLSRAERQSAIDRYDVLGTIAETEFDAIAKVMAQICGTHRGAVSLVAADRQWFKAQYGPALPPMPADPANPCVWVVEHGRLLAVPDMDADPRFRDRSDALQGLRFYAGAPLSTPDGHHIGTVCVMAEAPREGLSEAQGFMLTTLAQQVVDKLELRRALRREEEAAAEARADRERLHAVVESSTAFAIITTDREGVITGWNSGAAAILGWSEAETVGQPAGLFFTPEDCASGRPEEEGLRAVRDGSARDERWHVKKDGSRFWASGTVTPLRNAEGHVTGFLKILRDRTEQHLAGQALEASETFNRSILDASSDCIKVLDLEGRITFMSGPGLVVMEIDRLADILGRDWLDNWQGEARVAAGRAIETARRGGSARFQGFCPTAKGTPRWWDVVVSPIAGRDGLPNRLLAVSRDVTASQAREEALDHRNEQFRMAMDAGPVLGTWHWDVAGDRVVADAGLCACFGLDPAEGAAGLPIGRFLDAVHPEDRPRVEAGIERALREGGAFHADYRLPGRGPAPVWVEASGLCELDERGVARRFPGLLLDIDARKRAEAALQTLTETLEQRVRHRTEELRGERERLDAVLSNLPIGVALFGAPDALPIYSNGLLLDLLGLEALPQADAAACGAAYSALHADGRRYASEDYPVIRCIAGGAAVGPEDLIYRRGDGTQRLLSVRAAPVLGADGVPRYIVLAAEDVTRQRQVEESLRQAQKMEAVGQLTGGLAHDFNNLLAGIVGSLEMIRARVAQGRTGELDRYLGAAVTSANRAASLTHRLLAFSRRQTLDPKPLDVDRLARGMEDLIRRTVGPEIALETAMPGGLWTVLCDPHQLENALLNLAINARDAMPGGGRLAVEARNVHLDSVAAALERDMAPGQYVAIGVSDTGTGMDRATLERVFEPFFTTKPMGQGTGLGLSMVYGFARQSGGQVRIHSAPGEGTRVRIYLPRHLGEAEAETGEEPRPAAPARALNGESVLVVDDEPVVRMLVGDVLKELGYAAIQAGDGAEGLRVVESGRPLDLLVTDVGLPGGMNGRQLADAARSLRPGLKVLFITGYAESAALGEGALEPGLGVLGKPFSIEVLAAKIREMLGVG